MASKTPSKSRPNTPGKTTASGHAYNPADMTDDFGGGTGRNMGDITNPFLSRSTFPSTTNTNTSKSAPSSPVRRTSSSNMASIGSAMSSVSNGLGNGAGIIGSGMRHNVIGENGDLIHGAGIGGDGSGIGINEGGERSRGMSRNGGGMGRSGSQGEKSQYSGRNLDRFIPSRPSSAASIDRPSMHHASSSMSSMHGDQSFNNTNLSNTSVTNGSSGPNASMDGGQVDGSSGSGQGQTGPHTRILSFHAAPPGASSSGMNPHASSHLELSASYLPSSRSGSTSGRANASASGSATNPSGQSSLNKRRIPTIPDRVLDAPGYLDDYYLNLLSWSNTNKVGIALGRVAYVWNAEDGGVVGLGEDYANEDGDPNDEAGRTICSLSWATDGAYLAVGLSSGAVEVWDAERQVRVRTMRGHQARVSSLSWTGHVLSTGCKDGSIHHNDVRTPRHITHRLKAHTQEVCGLTWRSDGQLLASGANDNMVAVWDHRVMTDSVLREAARTDEAAPVVGPRWTKTNHTAAVKALAWCPWQSSLLATGGGSGDHTIHFWNATTGARLSSLQTASQITSLQWSPHSKEILATHGFPNHALSLWAYPSMQRVSELPNAHDSRILTSALSPDGCTVVTGAGDENLKFWKIWEPKSGYKAKSDEREENLMMKGKPAMGTWR